MSVIGFYSKDGKIHPISSRKGHVSAIQHRSYTFNITKDNAEYVADLVIKSLEGGRPVVFTIFNESRLLPEERQLLLEVPPPNDILTASGERIDELVDDVVVKVGSESPHHQGIRRIIADHEFYRNSFSPSMTTKDKIKLVEQQLGSSFDGKLNRIVRVEVI